MTRSTPHAGERPPEPHRVITISLYESDLARVDAMVRAVRETGVARATRSALIRLALIRLDVAEVDRAAIETVCARVAVPKDWPKGRSWTQCSRCGEAGHNKRSCRQSSAPRSKEP